MVSCRNINKDVIINRLLSLHASWIPSRVTKLRHRYPGSVVPYNLLSFINFILFYRYMQGEKDSRDMILSHVDSFPLEQSSGG